MTRWVGPAWPTVSHWEWSETPRSCPLHVAIYYARTLEIWGALGAEMHRHPHFTAVKNVKSRQADSDQFDSKFIQYDPQDWLFHKGFCGKWAFHYIPTWTSWNNLLNTLQKSIYIWAYPGRLVPPSHYTCIWHPSLVYILAAPLHHTVCHGPMAMLPSAWVYLCKTLCRVTSHSNPTITWHFEDQLFKSLWRWTSLVKYTRHANPD